MEAAKLRDITICALCKKRLHAAKLLPCLDSFCLKCLQDLAGDREPGDELSCPTCEATFQIPDEGLSVLPANSFVDILLQRISSSRDDAKNLHCDACGTEAAKSPPVTSYCLDCRQNMCEECCGYHGRFSGTKEHKMMSRGQEEGGSLKLEDMEWCDIHRHRRRELYCRECGLSVCVKCYVEKHNSHSCSDISKVAEEFREEMQKTVNEMEQLTLENQSEERRLRAARDNILDQLTETELLVLRSRQELISCIERDTNELMNDLQQFRDFVTDEYDVSHGKIRNRSEEIDTFKQFAKEVVNEGSASAVADITGAVNERASEIREHSQKSRTRKRPSVDVTFQSLGLCHLSQAKNKRKVNLIGRVTATIIPLEPSFQQKMQTTNWLTTKAMPKREEPVFKFGSTSSPARLTSTDTENVQFVHVPRIRHSKLFRPCSASRRNYVIRQRQQLNDDSDLSSSSDEDNVQEGDEDAVSRSAAEAAKKGAESEETSSPATVEDYRSLAMNVIFSHEAKFYRFSGGSWRLRCIGNMEVAKLQEKNIAYLLMKNKQTQKICLAQSVTSDLSLESAAEPHGRRLTWIMNVGLDDYEMYMVRFKSQVVAANFRMAFVCARELMIVGRRSAAASATYTDAASSSAASDSLSVNVMRIVTSSSSSSSQIVAHTTVSPASAAATATSTAPVQGRLIYRVRRARAQGTQTSGGKKHGFF